MSDEQHPGMIDRSPALEQRLAAVLAAENATSEELQALIEEVESAIGDAAETAEQHYAEALDLGCNDAVAAEQMARAAELVRKRLKVAHARLQVRLPATVQNEYRERWLADARRVETMRDAAAQNFARYPELLEQLLAIFHEANSVDVEIDRVNSAAPSTVSRLACVELTARHLEAFSQYQPSITKELQLPDWEYSQRMAYPPPQVPLGVRIAQAITFNPPLPRPEGPQYGAERAAAVRDEEGRRIAFYDRQARERKERENAAPGVFPKT